jgi:hypothetical protein
MEYLHECTFCGWSRQAASPTILSPQCPACGCTLRSERAAIGTKLPAGPADAVTPWVSPPLARSLGRVAGILFVLAAAKAGYEAGGLWPALGGLSLVGLLTVPLLAPDG